EVQAAPHQRGVARERAEEGVVPAFLQAGGGEGYRGALAASDHLARGNHAVVVGGHVAGFGAGGEAVGRHAREVRGFNNHHVVAHRRLGQLAHVLEVDGELAAAGRDVDLVQVELHAVVAFQRDIAAAGRGGGLVASGGRVARRVRGGGVHGGVDRRGLVAGCGPVHRGHRVHRCRVHPRGVGGHGIRRRGVDRNGGGGVGGGRCQHIVVSAAGRESQRARQATRSDPLFHA